MFYSFLPGSPYGAPPDRVPAAQPRARRSAGSGQGVRERLRWARAALPRVELGFGFGWLGWLSGWLAFGWISAGFRLDFGLISILFGFGFGSISIWLDFGLIWIWFDFGWIWLDFDSILVGFGWIWFGFGSDFGSF